MENAKYLKHAFSNNIPHSTPVTEILLAKGTDEVKTMKEKPRECAGTVTLLALAHEGPSPQPHTCKDGADGDISLPK